MPQEVVADTSMPRGAQLYSIQTLPPQVGLTDFYAQLLWDATLFNVHLLGTFWTPRSAEKTAATASKTTFVIPELGKKFPITQNCLLYFCRRLELAGKKPSSFGFL